MTHTAAILEFVTAPHQLPAGVRADALRLLGDTLAVGVAGAGTGEAQAVRRLCGGSGLPSQARCLDGSRATADAAAFFNGFAIHCLEWDAVHEGAVVHALSVVTAALLAASDRMGGSDPDAFLTALAVGVDVASGLGIAAAGPMRFFRPATAGTIGAALAVARLEGADPAKALGFAYSFLGGTMQAHVEASIALPLQIARAAQAAIQAVDLAKAGMVPPYDVLEGPYGYSALIEPLELARYTAELGQIWRIAEVSIKPFPSGRASHAVLGAIQSLDLRGEEVARLTAKVPPLIQRLIGRPAYHGMAPSHARLCLPFLIALMLEDGAINPARFIPDVLSDPRLLDLASRVSVELDGNPDPNALGPQQLIVELRDRQIDIALPETLGSPKLPLSPQQSESKYQLCRDLADQCEPRLFDNPLCYATDPK